jgi:hypothetical protein
MNDLRAWGCAVLLAVASTACCNRGKSRSELFAVLDKHRLAYGKCELIAKSPGNVDGQPAWLAATACRARHKRAVIEEAGDTRNFEAWFKEWEKENGPRAIEDARAAPSAASGNDCPSGAACLNRCMAECEGKHGKLVDTAAMVACNKKGGKSEECTNKTANRPAQSCFLRCRGL